MMLCGLYPSTENSFSSFNERTKFMGNIGIYGGTFDPIHFGHLNMALELMELCQLEEVWFCPTRLSPHKQDNSLPAFHRLEMLKLALNDISNFRILTLEIYREGPSYTIDTIKTLLKEEHLSTSARKLYLMLGEDHLPHFEKWHKVEEIIQLVPLLIAKRQGKSPSPYSQKKVIKQAIEKGLQETGIMEISATNIRKRLKKGLYCGHLLPQKVLDYIYQNQLYCTSSQ